VGLDPDEPLAPVLAAIESRERVGAGFEAVEDVLLLTQLARADPAREGRDRGFHRMIPARIKPTDSAVDCRKFRAPEAPANPDRQECPIPEDLDPIAHPHENH